MADIEHPTPQNPPQYQDRQPGLEADMRPQPQFHDPTYRGSGKLNGKVALITGSDSLIKQDRDIVLKVIATAICGSDLHIYSGGLPPTRSIVLGHEFMGIVEEVSSSIIELKQDDRIVVRDYPYGDMTLKSRSMR